MTRLPPHHPALMALAEDLDLEVPPAAEATELDRAHRWLVGQGALARDVTCAAVVPLEARVTARIEGRAVGVLAGVGVAADVFRMLDPDARITQHKSDGEPVGPGELVLEVEGRGAAVLVAERTALNLLQRLSGVATATRELVASTGGLAVQVLDTRKTTPGLRALQRRAVLAGGGVNHRFGLSDQVLLKENHFALSGQGYRETVAKAVAAQPAGAPPVIAEVRDAAEAHGALEGGAGVILLDNFTAGDELAALVVELRQKAASLGRVVAFEVSGGITAATAEAYARCGVDRLSVGAMTHSAPALDLSLLLQPSVEVNRG